MKRFADWSLTTKLRGVITGVCMLTVSATCVGWSIYERHTVKAQLPVAQLVRSRVIAQNVSASLAFSTPRDAEELLAALKVDPHITWAAVFEPTGRVFATYALPGARAVLPDQAVMGEGYLYAPGHLLMWTPVVAGTQRLGTLVMDRALDDLDARLRTIPLIAIGGMVFAGLAAFWLATVLQRLISDPILHLAATAAKVTDLKDYSLRADPSSHDEIGHLAQAFNGMLGTIDATLAANGRLYEQVRLHADQLELRVKERTVELEYANEELEAFGSSVSHDLRGPLRYIDGYAQAVLEDPASRLTPESREYLRKIVERAARMHSLINVLLEFSRLNRHALNPEPIDLAQLGVEVFTELRSEYPDRDVRLRMVALPRCAADRVLIRQVLINLLSNAIKYTRGRSPAIVEIGATETGSEVEYFVRDNGIGFDPKRAAKLFTAFERLHDPRQFEGTGVGLATVKRIIQRHGGSIRAESVLNVGTTFYFTLPVAPDAQ